MEREELKLELERLADRFSEGWHEGIKIDASDIILLNEAAQALAQPAQEPKSVTYKEVADTMNALRKGNFSQQAAAKEVGKLKLYTTPPQRPWVGLTPEETSGFTQHEMTVAKYVSKVLQEKNT